MRTTYPAQRPCTKTIYRQQLPNVPFDFITGNYTLIACVSDPDREAGHLFKVWNGSEFLTLTTLEYGLRFHEVPPRELSIHNSGVAKDVWDHVTGKCLDMLITTQRYNDLMDILIHELVAANRSILEPVMPKPSVKTGRAGRYFSSKKPLNNPATIHKLITVATPPEQKPVVSTKGLRELLVRRGLRPDLAAK